MLKVSDYKERSETEAERFLEKHSHLSPFITAEFTDLLSKAASLEEQVLLCRKQVPENGQLGESHILICATDTGGFNACKPLIEEALKSDAVKSISLNFAASALLHFMQSNFKDRFLRINPEDKPVAYKRGLLFDREIAGAPVSSVVLTTGTYSGLEDSWLLSAKSIFGAQNLVFLQDHWAPYNPSQIDHLSRNSDAVDLILCNDSATAAQIAQSSLLFKDTKIAATGTGVLPQSTSAELEKMRSEGRGLLGIGEEKAVLLLGSYEQKGVFTLSDTLKKAVINISNTTTEPVSVVIRPHPADPNVETLLEFIREANLYNINLIYGGREIISMDSARAAADIIVSINSTETLIGPMLSKPSAFLKAIDGNKHYEYYRAAIVANNGNVFELDDPESWSKFLECRKAAENKENNSGLLKNIGLEMLNAILENERRTKNLV